MISRPTALPSTTPAMAPAERPLDDAPSLPLLLLLGALGVGVGEAARGPTNNDAWRGNKGIRWLGCRGEVH